MRGTPAAPLAQLLRAVGPALRAAAGLGAWELVARPPPGSPPPMGRLLAAASLGAAPAGGFAEPTVLLLARVGGEEDVPQVCRMDGHVRPYVLAAGMRVSLVSYTAPKGTGGCGSGLRPIWFQPGELQGQMRCCCPCCGCCFIGLSSNTRTFCLACMHGPPSIA